MIREYISDVTAKIDQIRWLIKRESIEIEQPEETKIGYIKGNLTFIDDSKLSFSEIVSSTKKSYRFHYMGKNNRLIQRWDSAPFIKKSKLSLFTPIFPKGPLNHHQ